MPLLKPQYQYLKFKNEKEFSVWLEEKAKYKVVFEDKGQDFLIWWLDERGEVLHSEPFQASVWNGTMVILSSLKVDSYLKIVSNLRLKRSLIYKVIDITQLKQ